MSTTVKRKVCEDRVIGGSCRRHSVFSSLSAYDLPYQALDLFSVYPMDVSWLPLNGNIPNLLRALQRAGLAAGYPP